MEFNEKLLQVARDMAAEKAPAIKVFADLLETALPLIGLDPQRVMLRGFHGRYAGKPCIYVGFRYGNLRHEHYAPGWTREYPVREAHQWPCLVLLGDTPEHQQESLAMVLRVLTQNWREALIEKDPMGVRR